MNLKLKNKTLRIAVVQARWHSDIVDQCRISFINKIEELTGGAVVVDVYDAPGALEIPLLGQALARTDKYDAIVGTALVVDGGIYRHDFVATSVIDGLMRVQLDEGVPFFSAILTPHHFHSGDEHHDFYFEHFKVKGVEAAYACFNTLIAHAQVANAQ